MSVLVAVHVVPQLRDLHLFLIKTFDATYAFQHLNVNQDAYIVCVFPTVNHSYQYTRPPAARFSCYRGVYTSYTQCFHVHTIQASSCHATYTFATVHVHAHLHDLDVHVL